jgi:hypothetical protein
MGGFEMASNKIQINARKIVFRLKRLILKQVCSGSVLDTFL